MRPVPYTARAALAALLLAAAAAPASAWPRLGAQAGLGVFHLEEDAVLLDSESILTLLVGGRALFELRAPFSVQAGFEFVTKGTSFGEYEATDPTGNIIGTYEELHAVQYLQIPVLARASLPLPGRVRPYGVLGPTFAWELSEKRKLTGDVDNEFDVDGLKGFDFGGTAGLGVEVAAGPGAWTLEARYDRGFTDLDRGTFGGKAKNAGFQVTAGYLYQLRRP